MERRWGFLHQWWKVLKPCIHYCEYDTNEEYVWQLPDIVLKVSMPRRQRFDGDEAAFREHFQDVREALALLAAVEHASYDAYEYILTEHCGVRPKKYGEEVRIAVKFLLELDERGRETNADDATVEYDLVRFCGTHQREHSSKEYLAALNHIAAFDKNLTGRKSGFDITIPVKLEFSARFMEGMPDDALRHYVRTIGEIIKAEREIAEQWKVYRRCTVKNDVEAGALRCTFELEPLSADADFMAVSLEDARGITGLLSDNARFSFLAFSMPIERAGAAEFEVKTVLGHLFRHAFGSTQRKHVDDQYYFDASVIGQQLAQGSQLATLKLTCASTTPSSDFEAVCSAMMFTRTTTSISLELEMNTLDQVTREHRWKWLAYALFSKRAQTFSAVDSLILPDLNELNIVDVQALNSILMSEHPEETLFGTSRGLVDERDATIKSGAPIRWEFDEQGQPVLNTQFLALEDAIPLVRTFSDDGESEWVNTLVPGFGHCQVERANLDFRCVATPPTNSGGVASLTISCCMVQMTHFEGLVPFFKSIGSSLTKLILDGPEVAHHRDMDENAIIRSCPNLQELTLVGQLVDVQLDFSEYRAAKMSVPDLTFGWDDVMVLANHLRDPTNPLTNCVRRLRMCLSHSENASNIVDAIGSMLDANKRLEYLYIEAPFDELLESLNRFHLQPLPRQSMPLPRKCVLAFLSAVAARSPLTDVSRKKMMHVPEPALAKIDHHVMENIFSFAALPVIRQVCL